MVLPLPSALTEFSKAALQNISALDGIVKSIPNIQGTVTQNVTSAATKSITSQPGNIFSSVSSVVDEANGRFLEAITGPRSLDLNLQRSAFAGLFGSGATGGPAVDAFLSANVRLEDIIPAQQLFNITKNLGATALYADPMQAYAQVTGAAINLANLCREANDIIAILQADITAFLTLQGSLNYTQIAQLDVGLFTSAHGKTKSALQVYGQIALTFQTRGRYDSAQISEFCALLTDIANALMFANSKFLEFDLLRKKIADGMRRLRAIGRQIVSLLAGAVKYIPAYAASALFGKLFQAIQGRVLVQTGLDLQRILADLEALTRLSADDRAKLLSTWAIGASIQAIRAYICEMQPASAVLAGEFASLHASYDALVGVLSLQDPTGLFGDLDDQSTGFESMMSASVIRDNGSDLSSGAALLVGVLAGLSAKLTLVCSACDTYHGDFTAANALNPDRAIGTSELFWSTGLDNAVDVAQSDSFDDITTMSLAESTKPGQLAESIRERIAVLPEGNERDQLTLLYDQVYSRHRATVLSMDFQRRQSLSTFVTLDEEEENRLLVNKTVKVFSGLDPDEFDEVLT